MSMKRHDRKRWNYVKSMVEEYPTRKGMELCGTDKREYDAVRAAIEATKKLPDSQIRLKIVDLTLWKNTRTLIGAARDVQYCERAAQRFRSEFIRTVAKNFFEDDMIF